MLIRIHEVIWTFPTEVLGVGSTPSNRYFWSLRLGITNFRKDYFSSAEMVFHREATRAQRDHVCSHKKEIVNHSVLIFQPSEEVR